MKNVVKIILAIGIIIIIFSAYVWGELYFDWKKNNSQEFQEIYMDLGDNYQIGKHNKINKLCNKDKEIGCLNGEIKGFKQLNGEVYLYLYLYRSVTKGRNKNESFKIIGYNYGPFLNDYLFLENEKDIPKFGYLNGDNLLFYSENDLKDFSQEQQNIFKELEKKPTIIIDGVDYTNK